MNRNEFLDLLEQRRDPFDLCIVGGGATGAGIALEAQRCGFNTVLVERRDFGIGTSSRSTKLIHGGIRYLAQGQISLVREALGERKALLHDAPHAVWPQRFVVPLSSGWEKLKFGIGLRLYDWLAQDTGLTATESLSCDELRVALPNLNTEKLRGALCYTDAQFDDARLLMDTLVTACQHGALAINDCEAQTLRRDRHGRVCGIAVYDHLRRHEFEIKATTVVNATGPYAAALDTGAKQRRYVMLSQGAHLVLPPRFLPGTDAVLFPKTPDGRVMFAIPWQQRVLVGTTDTPISEVTDHPRPQESEIDQILTVCRDFLTHAPTRSDCLSVFAGVRPLAAETIPNANGTASVSREHAVHELEAGHIYITGGKWTTFRHMARDCMRLVGKTTHHGGNGAAQATPILESLKIARGDDVDYHSLLAHDSAMKEALIPGLPYTVGHCVWSCRHEMASTLDDVLARRTRALLLDAAACLRSAKKVAHIMANVLGHDDNWIASEVARFHDIARSYLPIPQP